MKQGFLCILYWCIILYPVERKNTNGNELPDQTSKSVLNCNYLKTWHETGRPLTCHVGFFYYPIDKRLIISIRKLSTYLHSYVNCHHTYVMLQRQKQLTPREITSADWILRHIIIHSIIPCIHSVTCTAVRLEALALSRALDYNRIQSKSSRKVLVASSLSLKKDQ